MKIVRGSTLSFVPASHEDHKNPEVWKKVLLTHKELTLGRVQMVNWSKLPVGKTFKLHYHENMEEVFILLCGKTKITVDSEEADMEKGDLVIIPAKSTHMMKNIGDIDVEYLVFGITTSEKGKTVIVE